MLNLKCHSPAIIFACFIAANLLVGWLIPGFYAWTDSDQSRPSPLLWKVPLGAAIGSVVFCVVLPWLPVAINPSNNYQLPLLRFSMRALLMLTTGIAVAIPLLAKFPLVMSGLVSAGACAYFIAFCVRNPQHRMAASALVACMVLPYAWVVGYSGLGRILPNIASMFAGMPAFVPAALIGRLLGQHIQEMQWLAFLLTALELVVGTWVIRVGPKRTITYLLLVMQSSVLGSLVFYMLCRA